MTADQLAKAEAARRAAPLLAALVARHRAENADQPARARSASPRVVPEGDYSKAAS